MSVDDELDDDGSYCVNERQIAATGGSELNNDVEITLTAYRSNRQVCGTLSRYLSSDDFFGI